MKALSHAQMHLKLKVKASSPRSVHNLLYYSKLYYAFCKPWNEIDLFFLFLTECNRTRVRQNQTCFRKFAERNGKRYVFFFYFVQFTID